MSGTSSTRPSSEHDPFLPYGDEKRESSDDDDNRATAPRKSRQSLYRRLGIYLLHISLLAANIVWLAVNSHFKSVERPHQGTLYEPSDAPFQATEKNWNLYLGQKTPFTSFDRSIADKAWESISMKISLGWIKQPKAKVDAMDQPSVEFADGSGFFYGMDVFHQLHCLNYLRKKSVLYNHLYPSDGEDQQVPPEFHIPHCIDSIRLSLQCHADLSLVPQRWADNWLEPWAVWTNKHQCRDFDAIRDWAIASSPKLAGTLEHPELGTVVSDRLNLSALPIWQEPHDEDVVIGHMPTCHVHDH